ncbi:acyltransferase family protein [Paludisphaera rhizosphaerae]|uniref:acyltransferase family protein n=1 Tax=Paludisphaera rhizosphaerae TaxID=2711216 RepID=UPI0013E9CE57|nr:acyltransferase family protein [Paludisphaera rhizosphaerae]
MSHSHPPFARRSDLDALRAVAMLLGIVLHASLSFFPAFWVVSDSRQAPGLGILFSAIHGFRMPLFFVMSGFFTAMLLHRRGPGALVKHRFRRVFLPLLLGLVTVVPAVHWISGVAMSSASQGTDEPSADAKKATIGTAAEAGDLDAIERRLADGASVNDLVGEFQVTPLHLTALANKASAVKLLVDRGANVNAAATDGGTPLHAAAFVGADEAVAALIAGGADVNAVNKRGKTPLDNAIVDEGTTIYFASMLKLTVNEDGLGRRKAAIAESLRQRGAITGKPDNLADLLMQIPLFSHLWFLWFLWWLVLGLAAVSLVGTRLPAVRPPAWLIVSPARYLWLIPLTMLPQWLMGDGVFGPDTSSGILPIPHVLAYYAIFFGFGALDYAYDDHAARVGSRWGLPLAIALLVVFPLGMALTTGWPEPLAATFGGLDPSQRRLLSTALQAAYPWLMTFGLMGLFRRFWPEESPTMRYLSDSAYWLYLAHLPLVIAAQYLVRDWPIPSLAKLVLIVAVSTALLLVSYQFLVRYTWLGRLLNGPRARPEPAETAPAAA